MQVCPVLQVRSQAPQLCASVPGSTHEPPHEIRPSVHVHLPSAQISSALHVLPHAPQLPGSCAESTQPMSSQNLGASDGHEHLPPAQLRASEHCLPQAPQLRTSESVSPQVFVAPLLAVPPAPAALALAPPLPPFEEAAAGAPDALHPRQSWAARTNAAKARHALRLFFHLESRVPYPSAIGQRL